MYRQALFARLYSDKKSRINRFKIYDAFDDSSEFYGTTKKCDIINFDKQCEINLALLKELIFLPAWIKDFAFTHAKALFYERLCD